MATLLVGLALVAAGDRTGWSNGFGWDGRTYGDVAQHFPGAVFGDDGVVPPGYGPYTGPKEKGVDDYYVRRILPSAVVYYSLSALSIDHSPDNVIACFGIWNALIIALVALLWCLTADRLGLRREAKWLGLIALLANFAILKAAFYWPVATDTFAFGFGAATLYFWISRNTLALAAVTFLGSFAWPTQLLFGSLLLLFGPRDQPLESGPLRWDGQRRRSTAVRTALAAVPALALLGFLVIEKIDDYGAPYGIELGGVFPFAAAIAALFVFCSVLWLLPDLSRQRAKEIAGSLLSRRLLLVAGLVALVFGTQAAIADRASIIDQGGLLKASLWYSALNPGLFAVALAGFFGPVIVLAAISWPRLCRQALAFGPGAALVLALAVGTCLLTESRKLIVLFPFLVLFAVVANESIAARRWFLPSFFAASLIVSRVWLPIGKFGAGALTDFPAQRYFMSSGIWTSSGMYLLQLAAVAAVALLIAAFLERPRLLTRRT